MNTAFPILLSYAVLLFLLITVGYSPGVLAMKGGRRTYHEDIIFNHRHVCLGATEVPVLTTQGACTHTEVPVLRTSE